ncbi:DUF485 domain-containing protein [Streptomyces sp. NPDC001288]|uniref:DUF485 domain-containing protein n=1 Tax=Streptomyces sp. NPDC001297 TaxID=3364559 RepID=UPI00368F3A9D
MSHHPPAGAYTWPAHHGAASSQAALEPSRHEDGFEYLSLPREACCRVWRLNTSAVLGLFSSFLLLAACAPGFMTRTVTTGMPVGLLLALEQFAVLLVAAVGCRHTAHRSAHPAEPPADAVREEEAGAAPWRGVVR